MAMRDRAIWLLRVLWFVLPVTAGPVLVDALADLSDGTRITLTAGLWLVWATGLVCVALLLPATLTGIRILAPAAVVAVAWGAADAGLDAVAAVGLVVSIGACFVAFSALVGDRMVDGASYGNERRMLLRPPTRLAMLALPVAWAAAVVGATAGPIVLANQRWLLGAVITAVGLPVAALAARVLHQMARRWIVFVPTGFVLHDLQVLTEPVLFRRTAIERLGPAIAGTPAKDLSNRSAGLLVECELTDPAPLGLRTLGDPRTDAEMVDVRRFLFVPSRPGDLLDEAESRRIAVA